MRLNNIIPAVVVAVAELIPLDQTVSTRAGTTYQQSSRSKDDSLVEIERHLHIWRSLLPNSHLLFRTFHSLVRPEPAVTHRLRVIIKVDEWPAGTIPTWSLQLQHPYKDTNTHSPCLYPLEIQLMSCYTPYASIRRRIQISEQKRRDGY